MQNPCVPPLNRRDVNGMIGRLRGTVAEVSEEDALIDVMAGHVPIMMDSVVSASPHVKAGKLRALAITSRQRSSLLPEVPTVAESGLPGYLAESWNGITAPAATPKAVIDPNRELRWLRRMWPLLAARKWRFFGALFAALVAMVAGVMIPRVTMSAIDQGLRSRSQIGRASCRERVSSPV